MGWWSENLKGKQLVIGDEPLDIASAMLRNVLSAYDKGIRRKPTAQELARTLEAALADKVDEIFEDAGNKELTGVIIKLRKRPDNQAFGVGDYFGVPLSKGGYGYGRIEDIVVKTLLLVGFLNVYSHELLDLSDVSGTPVLFELVCGSQGLTNLEWPVLGNVPSTQTHGSATEKERAMDYQLRLGGAYGYVAASKLLEDRLGPRDRNRRRFPWSR